MTKNNNDFTNMVIELGSYNCKIGFAGEETPLAIVPTVVGRSKFYHQKSEIGPEEQLVGEDVYENSCTVSPAYPIQNGIITNFDEMERMLNYLFLKELCVNPEDYGVLIIDSLLNKAQRPQIAEIMFESLRTPSIYMTNKSLTSLTACDVATGVDVHCGGGLFYSAPIYISKVIPQGFTKSIFSGGDVNEFLLKVLNERGYAFHFSREKEEIRKIKESKCFVSWDFNKSLDTYRNKNYGDIHYLRNGDAIALGDEMFRCPEAMFRPHLGGAIGMGLHETVFSSIMSCHIGLRETLFRNIVVTGGSSRSPGFTERLRREIMSLAAPYSMEVNVFENPIAHAAWVGGSELASHSTFEYLSITKPEFEEYGPQIINRKCA